MLRVLPLHPTREKRGSVRGRREGTLDRLVTQRRIWEHWKESSVVSSRCYLSPPRLQWAEQYPGACFMGSLLQHSTSGPFYQDHCSVAMIRKGKWQPRWARIHKGVRQLVQLLTYSSGVSTQTQWQMQHLYFTFFCNASQSTAFYIWPT